jgi:hypothetical protein
MHKCFEFDVDFWGFERGIHWLIISIETSYRTDHGGFHSIFVICNLKVEFNYYDVRLRDVTIWKANTEPSARPMNEHDVVRVKETVMVTPNFEDHPIEIKAGWKGTIIAHADKPIPLIEFNEEYRGKSFLVDLDVANLEVVWES